MSQQIPERSLGEYSIHMMRDEEAPGAVHGPGPVMKRRK